MDSELYKTLDKVIQDGLDSNDGSNLVLDRVFDQAQSYAGKFGMQAYCRIFWHDETDLDEALSDVLHFCIHKNAQGYATNEIVDWDATLITIMFKGDKDDANNA